MLTQRQIKEFQKEILDWYKFSKRDLPWREIPDGISLQDRFYRVLVSEIMLQQTQVSRVIPKYKTWLREFPTLASLVKAKTSDVLAAWSGLGYNRRALYLKKIAEVVMKNCNGKIPHNVDTLGQLPGIGEYTARAIACFAFDKQVAVVDTNVRKVIMLRVIARTPPRRGTWQSKKDSHAALGMTMPEIQELANQLLPRGQAYDWNHALMDYAAMMLAKDKAPSASWRTKQSKFLGSNRYYRGQIIKLLIVKKKATLSELRALFEKEPKEFDKIINGLKKDGLIKTVKETIYISS